LPLPPCIPFIAGCARRYTITRNIIVSISGKYVVSALVTPLIIVFILVCAVPVVALYSAPAKVKAIPNPNTSDIIKAGSFVRELSHPILSSDKAKKRRYLKGCY
jgi:hypothetical protein